MPNRSIKESICTSENLDQLAAEEEVFFYRLIVNCDDYGRTDGRPQILRAKCFPLRIDRVKEKDVEKWLSSLVKQRLIILYSTDDKPYIQVCTWEKHQQIRAKHSKFPAPDDDNSVLLSDDINCNQTISNVPDYDIRITNTNTNTKQRYAENVLITKEEYKKLIEQFGQAGTDDRIERLNLYKGSTGKKYKSDYLTILNWERKNQDKPSNQNQPIYPKQNLESDPGYIEFLKRGDTG